jgi:hypothetical protein
VGKIATRVSAWAQRAFDFAHAVSLHRRAFAHPTRAAERREAARDGAQHQFADQLLQRLASAECRIAGQHARQRRQEQADVEHLVATGAPTQTIPDGHHDRSNQEAAQQEPDADQHVGEFQRLLGRQRKAFGKADDGIAHLCLAEIEQRPLQRRERTHDPHRRQQQRNRVGTDQRKTT